MNVEINGIEWLILALNTIHINMVMTMNLLCFTLSIAANMSSMDFDFGDMNVFARQEVEMSSLMTSGSMKLWLLCPTLISSSYLPNFRS